MPGVGGNEMNRVRRIALLVIGVLLIINGLLNIWDDARVLTYDITSILAGIGFVIARLSGTNKPPNKPSEATP